MIRSPKPSPLISPAALTDVPDSSPAFTPLSTNPFVPFRPDNSSSAEKSAETEPMANAMLIARVRFFRLTWQHTTIVSPSPRLSTRRIQHLSDLHRFGESPNGYPSETLSGLITCLAEDSSESPAPVRFQSEIRRRPGRLICEVCRCKHPPRCSSGPRSNPRRCLKYAHG